MALSKTDLQSLSFPYFYIDKQRHIISQSEITLSLFKPDKYFLSLVKENDRKHFIDFLDNKSKISPLKIPLIHHDLSASYFYIHKLFDEKNGNNHLFCIQAGNDTYSVNNMIEKLEERLKIFNKRLKQKRDFFHQEMIDKKVEVASTGQMNTLAAEIAHEIRNPLTTVKGFIQLLKPHLNDIGKEYYADIALDEINRANEIIFEFLNTSKPQFGGKQGITLSDLLNDLYALYKNEATLHHIQLALSPIQENVVLMIDAQQIKQVFANIIKNAMEAIKEKAQIHGPMDGFIRISAKLLVDRVQIIISDNGGGLDEETLTHLFHPFYTTKDKGTGIGLAISREIIQAHGGTIVADSILGKGTTFTISLPLHSSENKESV